MSVEELLNRAAEAITRDIRAILDETNKGKLSAASARDLVNYYKLLMDLKKAQPSEDEALADLTDEQTIQQAKALIAEAEQRIKEKNPPDSPSG